MIASLVTDTAPPVIIPVLVPAWAMPVELLLHVPPALRSLNSVVKPEHTLSVPNIAVGNGLTVNTAVDIHPVGSL